MVCYVQELPQDLVLVGSSSDLRMCIPELCIQCSLCCPVLFNGNLICFLHDLGSEQTHLAWIPRQQKAVELTKVRVFIRSTKSVYSSVNGSFDFSGLSALSPVNFSYLHRAQASYENRRIGQVKQGDEAGTPSTYFLAMTSVRLTISAKLILS